MTSEELERKKREIEIILKEYEHAADDALEWLRDWRKRNNLPLDNEAA